MFKMKGTKRSLLMSVLALLLCVSMLIGSTFAWFTDSVTSAGNIIKSGTLKISMKWADGTKAVPAADSADWTDASKGPIFNYDKWEPGYTEARHIAVKNEGTLALKYQLTIVPTGEVSKLADVIDVYYIETATQLDERADLSAYTPVGTLTQLINNEISAVDVMPNGKLAAGEGFVATLVLKMQESAGNEYQDLSIGSEFAIQLLATQLTKEDDSYGPDYDKDAWAEGMKVYNANDLQAAINAGENPVLQNDIDLTEALVIPAAASTFSMRATPKATIIDLNGYTLSGTVGRDADNNRVHVIVNNGNLVLKNGTVASTGVNGGSAIYNADGATLTVENVTLNGAPQEGSTWPSYTVNNYGTLTVSDSSIYGVQGIIATNNTANTTVNNVIAYRDGWSSGHVFYTSSTAKVTINGGTYTNDGNGVDGTMIYGGETVVNGGTFIVKEGAYFALCSGSKLTVNGGDFSNIKSCIAWGGAMTISGGTFGFDPAKYLADGFKAVKTSAGYEVISTDRDYIVDGVLVSTDGKTYYISNATGYAWMDDQTDDFFLNKTVMIDADIDFGGAELNSIKFWNGKATVDGQGHTLSNFVITNTSGKAGLFEGTLKIQNLNVEKATVTGRYVGVLSGNMYGDIENCSVKNCEINGTYWQTGALAGQYNAGNITGCVVEDCTINGLSAVGGLIGILNESAGVRKIENCSLIDNEIVQTGSFGGAYDNYFGVAVGLINIDNSSVYFTNCKLEGNTLRGANSNVLYGEAEGSTKVYVDGAEMVTSLAGLQNAIDSAEDGDSILFGADIVGDVVVTQKPDVKITIDGNGYNFAGVLVVDGKSATYTTAGLTVKDVMFVADSVSADACIQLGDGTNATRYTCNVTVSGCTFDVPGVVGIKSYTGGDKNLKVIDCTATERAHSLMQAKGIDGILIEDCVVNSVRGANFNNSTNVTVVESAFDVQKYAVRFGEGSTATGDAETYRIENCTLKSANVDNDAAVVLRGTADKSTLTIVNTTIVGGIDNSAVDATVIQ